MLVWGFLFLFVCVCVYSLFFPDLAIMPCFVGWLITCFLILWFLLFSDFLEYPLLVTDRLYSLRNLLREFWHGKCSASNKAVHLQARKHCADSLFDVEPIPVNW